MNNNVQIDLTITMGDTCSNTMTMAEAKMLYDALVPIFGEKKEELVLNYPQGVKGVVYPDSFSESKVSSEKATGNILYENNEKVLNKAIDDNIASGSDKKDPGKIPPPNLKVEAARERASQRTRGCGQR